MTDAVPGGNPTLTWKANSEKDAHKYNIYRAMREDEIRPDSSEFIEIAEVLHADTSYTDTTVYMHTQRDNYKIWYYVTAEDETDHESLISKRICFWGYYEDGEFEEYVWVTQPENFSLSAAPNPFNPITTLHFNMPENAHVKLTIYNLSGRRVVTLIDNYREAGSHYLTWDAGSLPSGVYFANIQAGEYRSTQKLLLTK